MMRTRRNYRSNIDQQAMLALAYAMPTEQMHLIDLPYRFSSWAFDHPENIALWHDETGELIAWAVLQTPFWSLDYVYRTDLPELNAEIIDWADEQATAVLDTPYGRPIWFTNCFREQSRTADLGTMGFADQSYVAENPWSKVLMARPTGPIAVPSLPDGFTIRPLAGPTEVEGYVALHRDVFQSNSMTTEWRQRTLEQPAYRPELDLVVEAPDGRLAAFCICWLLDSGYNGAPAGQIEPLGVMEAYRHQGLAKAILAEGIRRLQQAGAKTIYVETDNDRDAAFALYESVGFRVWKDVPVYRKDYAPL